MSQSVGPSLPEKKSCIFYKLMVTSILQDQKLKIPNKFIKKFGDELSSIATLTVPSGRIWLIELIKENKRVWLDSGWNVFVEYYSISIGYFLVFRYEGNSHFDVHIYNLKASEINYRSSSLNNPREPDRDKHLKDIEDGSYFLMDDDLDECLRKRCKKSTCPDQKNDVHDLQATCRSTQDKGIQFTGVELTSTAGEGGRNFLKIKQEIEPNIDEYESLGKLDTPRNVHKRRGDVTTEGKQFALRAAMMFKPDNPFCKIILRPSYVYKGIFLHIPRCFALRYLNGVDGIITLQVSEGKKWPVRCIYGQSSWKFSKGWAEFVLDNNLDEGDVCVFELIDTKEIVLKVTIFRVLEDAVAVNQL